MHTPPQWPNTLLSPVVNLIFPFFQQAGPFNETYGSAFLESQRTTSASTRLSLDESHNSSHNQNLKRSGS